MGGEAGGCRVLPRCWHATTGRGARARPGGRRSLPRLAVLGSMVHGTELLDCIQRGSLLHVWCNAARSMCMPWAIGVLLPNQ